jgi:hypothetical protein
MLIDSSTSQFAIRFGHPYHLLFPILPNCPYLTQTLSTQSHHSIIV